MATLLLEPIDALGLRQPEEWRDLEASQLVAPEEAPQVRSAALSLVYMLSDCAIDTRSACSGAKVCCVAKGR